MNIYEKYRPQGLDSILGQPKALGVAKRLIQAGLGGKAVWISGPSGTGKTTLAYCLAHEIADDFCVEEIDASLLHPGKLAEIEQGSHLTGWGKGGRAYLVNEAHGLRKDTIRQLLVVLERIPRHVLWVFTSTKAGTESLFEDESDAGPLLSRTVQITLTNQGLADVFAARAMEIATAENLNGSTLDAYKKLVQRCKNNFRSVLQAIQAGEMAQA